MYSLWLIVTQSLYAVIISMHCLPVLHAILQALDSGDNILHATPLSSAQNSTKCRCALLRSIHLAPAAVFSWSSSCVLSWHLKLFPQNCRVEEYCKEASLASLGIVSAGAVSGRL